MTYMIKIGIYGYGNLGKGVEIATKLSKDMELVGIFTRREPSNLKSQTGTKIYSCNYTENMIDKIDVMIMCGGSANDLPVQTAQMASFFNVVDSFDTHAKIPEHFENINKICLKNNKVGIISTGWDPGMFSLMRLYGQAILPTGKDYTFWGPGVSQGHSDAIRRIPGVVDARQYTIPVEDSLNLVRTGKNPDLSVREKHTRECYVVINSDANPKEIEEKIKNMPNYFSDYDTNVYFITQEELDKNHKKLPHGGTVFRTGCTGLNRTNNHVIEYKLKLDSNPEFTAGVLVACARAAYRLSTDRNYGCKTIFDIPPAYLHERSNEDLRATIL